MSRSREWVRSAWAARCRGRRSGCGFRPAVARLEGDPPVPPPPPPVPVVGIVNGQLSVLPGPLTPVVRRGKAVRGRFEQVVTVFNTSDQPIASPLALVLAGLRPQRHHHGKPVSLDRVLNELGTTVAISPGSPFVADAFSAAELQSFAGVSFTLEFQVSGSGHVAYTPILVAGLTP